MQGKMTYSGDSNVQRLSTVPQSANTVFDLLHAYLRNEVVRTTVVPTLRSVASASEENLIRLGEPHWGFMREDRARLRCDSPDGRLLPQDTQELRVIDLEERWVGVGRIEVFVERILAESTTLA